MMGDVLTNRLHILKHTRVLWVILLLFAGGCAALPKSSPQMRAVAVYGFKTVPVVPSDYPRAEQALLSVFFQLSGVPLAREDVLTILPLHIPGMQPDIPALKRIALQNNRILLAVRADQRFLWRQLGNEMPLLLNVGRQLVMPVVWDRKARHVTLLSGDGQVQTMDEDAFFQSREAQDHKAMCLFDPHERLPWPPSREERIILGEYWEKAGEPKQAAKEYQAILKTYRPDAVAAQAHAGLGRLAVQDGRDHEAIYQLELANALQPENPRLLNTLAYLLATVGNQPYSARKYAEEADKLDAGNPAILETLGVVEMHLGNPLRAATYFERAWAMTKMRELSSADHAQIMEQLVRAHEASNRPDLAQQVLVHRIRLHPNLPLPADLRDLATGEGNALF